MYDLQHPAIGHAERDGIPGSRRCCARCGDDLGLYSFLVDDEPICEGCLEEWVLDYLQTNPREVAEALGVAVRYHG